MMHALGFWHEQVRGDRDDFVTVVWDNVMDVATGNFKKQERFWDNYGSPYDLGSVMHYGGTYFTKKRKTPTILVKATGKAVKAQRVDFSDEDVRQINLKYKCSAYLKKSDRERIALESRAAKCKDLIVTDVCQQFKDRGFCRHSSVVSKCQKTCDSCDSDVAKETADVKEIADDRAGPCADAVSNCDFWVSEGYCDKYASYMKKNCQKSCNLCKKKDAEEVADDEENFDASCRDFSKNCKGWLVDGYCRSTTYRIYMKRVCARSCGICTTAKMGKFPDYKEKNIKLYWGKCGVPDPELRSTISARVVGG